MRAQRDVILLQTFLIALESILNGVTIRTTTDKTGLPMAIIYKKLGGLVGISQVIRNNPMGLYDIKNAADKHKRKILFYEFAQVILFTLHRH